VPQSVTIPSGGSAVLEIPEPLRPGPSTRVDIQWVHHRTGQPGRWAYGEGLDIQVPGYTVFLHGFRDGREPWTARAEPDVSGHVTLFVPPDLADSQLWTWAPESAPVEFRDTATGRRLPDQDLSSGGDRISPPLDQGPVSLRAVYHEPSTVLVRLTSADGRPLVHPRVGHTQGMVGWQKPESVLSYGGFEPLPDGRFRTRSIPATESNRDGRVVPSTLVATADGHAIVERPIVVPPDAILELDVVLEPLDPAAPVRPEEARPQ
jgi:hypothetical protein